MVRDRDRDRPADGRFPGWSIITGAALCAGLTGGLVSPAWAASAGAAEAADVRLGSFALGDALEGTIGELDGSFEFAVAAGGVQLAWDSRRVGIDAVRLGEGWSFGLPTMRVVGGIWVYPASGGAYEMDASSTTGLAGYPRADVRFEAAEPGAVVPARADGSVEDAPYEYVLHELGGLSTYFDGAGFPVARLIFGGDRLDWRWEAGTGHLLAVTGADGSVTALDWSDPARLVVRPGSTVTDPVDGSGAGGEWEIEFENARVSSVTGPDGGRTHIRYDHHDLVERVSTPSGAATEVQWQRSTDSIDRVDRVRVVDDASAAELSVRRWGVQGEVTPTGWPLTAGAGPSDAAPDPAAAFETWISDGSTRVTSAVDGRRRLTGRAVVVASASGERVVQEQAFEYPDQDAPPWVPEVATQPTAISTTHRDRHGGSRAATESYEYDELGRMTLRIAADGATMTREYDDELPPDGPLPIGLVTVERTTTADGLVTSKRSELSEDRAAVVVAEQWSGREGTELTRVGRVESDVEAGFVTEERVFPVGDPDATAIVTTQSKQIDLARGTKTITQTVAAGTAIEASTTTVSSLVHGGVLSETDAVGNRTSSRYDRAGRQIAVADAGGRSTETRYLTRQHDGVNAVAVTTGTGLTVTETDDALGRLVQKADNIAPTGRAVAGHERVFETRDHDTLGVERVTDAWGAVTTTEHDVFGRTKRVAQPNGVVQVAEYDDVAGTATSGVTLSGHLSDAEVISTNVLDDAGHVTKTSGVRADGLPVPETSAEFDGFGREVRATGVGTSTTTEHDVYGNAVITTLDPVDGAGGGMTEERRYDAFGVSVEKTRHSETETLPGYRQELDELGRVVALTDQRGATERTLYTPDGLVEQVVSGTGRVTRHSYDPESRALLSTRVSTAEGATLETAYRHDAAGRVIAVYDPADESGTRIASEYDDFGNRTRIEYPDGTTVRHEFDPHGRKTATIDGDGNRTEYAYDEVDGSLLAATQTDRDDVPVGGVRYEHDAYGRVSAIVRDNGVRTEYAFTSTGQVLREATTGPEGVISQREYGYSPAGSLTSRVDRTLDEAKRLKSTRTEYEYDAFNRLVRSVVRDGDAAGDRVTTRTEYEPTLAGDLASETVTTDPDTAQATSTHRRFDYSETGELTAIVTDGERRTQEFDAEGNLLASAVGGRYAYDVAGRLVTQTTPDGVHIETSYWADGSRREQRTADGSIRFYWDDARLLNEVHAAAGGEHGVASYLIGTNRQARSIRPEGGERTTTYYGTDRHGNVTDLTDRGGAVTMQYGYSDYGVATVTAFGEQPAPLPGGIGELRTNPFQYAGEYTSRDGTQPLGARTYDPMQVRFLSKDAAPLANLYAFGDLNPITNVDPTGRWSEEDWKHAGLVIAGFVLTVVGGVTMLATAGTSLLAFGVVASFVVADIGFEIAKGVHELGDDKFMDPRATEIVAWGLALGGLAIGIGGSSRKFLSWVEDPKRLAHNGAQFVSKHGTELENLATKFGQRVDFPHPTIKGFADTAGGLLDQASLLASRIQRGAEEFNALTLRLRNERAIERWGGLARESRVKYMQDRLGALERGIASDSADLDRLLAQAYSALYDAAHQAKFFSKAPKPPDWKPSDYDVLNTAYRELAEPAYKTLVESRKAVGDLIGRKYYSESSVEKMIKRF